MDIKLLILAIIVLISNIVEAISGFGSTIISVTLGSNLYSIDELLPVIVPVNLLLSFYLILRYRSDIDISFLMRKILPFMGFGMVLGLAVFNLVNTNSLKQVYGVLIIILSVRELNILFKFNAREVPPQLSVAEPSLLLTIGSISQTVFFTWGAIITSVLGVISFRKNTENLRVMGRNESYFWLALSGVVHGIFASGGPLLVYALSSLKMNKDAFRSNLSVIWAVLNTILVLSYLQTGKINFQSLQSSAFLLPMLPLGIIIGEIAHKNLDEKKFKMIIFSILFFAGICLTL